MCRRAFGLLYFATGDGIGRLIRMFGVREFQLALLDSMYDEVPDKVKGALHVLHATRAQSTSAAAELNHMGTRRVYGDLIRPNDINTADYARILGDPISIDVLAEYRILYWDLPLWPDFWFAVHEAPDHICATLK